METTTFIPFWFEGNQAWGEIDSVEKWFDHIVWHYAKWERGGVPASVRLMERAQATIKTEDVECHGKKRDEDYTPNFGLYSEHNAKLTLAEWSKKNGMYEMMEKKPD